MSNKRRRATSLIAGASVLGAGLGVPLALTGTANAATMDQWNLVAQCESGQDWAINYSSDGLSVGGLQFQNPSWQSALEYLNSKGYDTSSWTQTLYQGMPRGSVPTKDQTVLAGEALLHLQGPSAWVCDTTQGGVLSASMFDGGPNPWGLSGTNVPDSLKGPNSPATPTPTPTTPAPSPKPTHHNHKPVVVHHHKKAYHPVKTKGGTSYTVVKDDWLSKLALRYYGNANLWPEIYAANQAVIGSNPDLIFPGQRFVIPNHSAVVTPPQQNPTPAPTNPTPTTPATPSDPTPAPSNGVVNGWANPLANMVVAQSYGNPDSGYQVGYHTGVDLSVGGKTGVAAKAIHAGKVVFAGRGNLPGAGAAYGNHVILQLPDGKFALYAHLASLSVQTGQTVTAGQMVGIVGATGNANGIHLHFEIRKSATDYYDGNFQDPIAYLHSHGL